MPTDPLTGSRYPAASDSPNIAQYIQNAVTDLSDNTLPRFTTTSARDAAYAAWVTAGGAMTSGLFCVVAGVIQEYNGTSWGAPLLYGIEMARTSTVAVGNSALENQGFAAGNVTFDKGGFYNGVGADIIKVPAGLGGLYICTINSGMAGVVTGRHLAVLTNGTAGAQVFRANGAYNDSAQASGVVRLAAGAALGVQLFQASGATMNNNTLSFSIHLIGR